MGRSRHTPPSEEMRADIFDLLDQLYTIEHEQDHELVKKIGKKYGYEPYEGKDKS